MLVIVFLGFILDRFRESGILEVLCIVFKLSVVLLVFVRVVFTFFIEVIFFKVYRLLVYYL